MKIRRLARRLLRNRRAITPVLSNLLLTVVAVAVMSLATTATYMITTDMRENMSERLIVEDVWFTNGTGGVSLYLRNIGKVAIHVSNVYLNHSTAFFLRPFDLELGRSGWLNVSEVWTSGSLYFLDVVTNRGTHAGGYYQAP